MTRLVVTGSDDALSLPPRHRRGGAVSGLALGVIAYQAPRIVDCRGREWG